MYENKSIRIWDSKGLELGETESQFTEQTHNFIRTKQEDKSIDNHIHLVWYTIQGPGARITECDKNLINKIFRKDHVIVVITKDDVTRPNQREALKNVLLDMEIPAERIIFTCDEEGGSEGCENLTKLSHSMLPAAYKEAFVDAQRIDTELKIQAVHDKSTKAYGIIGTATAAAAAAGAIPIPFSDAAVLMPIQITMLASLAALY